MSAFLMMGQRFDPHHREIAERCIATNPYAAAAFRAWFNGHLTFEQAMAQALHYLCETNGELRWRPRLSGVDPSRLF